MVISRKYSIMALAFSALVITSKQAVAAMPTYAKAFQDKVLVKPASEYGRVKAFLGGFYNVMPKINSPEAVTVFIEQLNEATMKAFFDNLGAFLVSQAASLEKIKDSASGIVYDVPGTETVRDYSERFFQKRYTDSKTIAIGNADVLAVLEVWNTMILAGFDRVDANVRAAKDGCLRLDAESADAFAMAGISSGALDEVLVIFKGLTNAKAKPSLVALWQAFVTADVNFTQFIGENRNPAVATIAAKLADYLSIIFQKAIAVDVKGIPAEVLLPADKKYSVERQVAAWTQAFLTKWEKASQIDEPAPVGRRKKCNACTLVSVGAAVIIPVVAAGLYWLGMATGS